MPCVDSEVTETKRGQKPGLRWLRRLGWVAAGVFSLLVVVLLAGACWLWGWQWGNTTLKFHDSWKMEERAALSGFEAYLRTDYIQELMQYEMPDAHPLYIWLSSAYLKKILAAPVCVQLREIAGSGRADLPGVDTAAGSGITPAILAVQNGYFEALKALVLHGADPNACVFITSRNEVETEAETLLSPLMSDNYSRPDFHVPWETRREVAEFLLAHGADINADKRILGLCCHIALSRGDASPWLWALEKGRRVPPELFPFVVTGTEPQLELIEAMLKQSPALANSCDAGRNVLQRVVEHACSFPEDLPKMEPVLRLLLQYGADPTLMPSGDEYGEAQTWLPLERLQENPPGRSRRRKDATPVRQDTPEYAAWQRMCEMLKR